MLYQILRCGPSLFNLQRCFFPSNIPSGDYGKYAIVTTSSGRKYLVRICVNTLLQENICILDETVQFSPVNSFISGQRTLAYEAVDIISSVNYIKNVYIEIVFKSIWDAQKWINKREQFKELVKQILQLFVLSNNVILNLCDIVDINKVNVHYIIVKSIGNISAGRIVDTSKLFIDKVTCFERYRQCQGPNASNIYGFTPHQAYLKKLLTSVENNISTPSTLRLNSSLKVLIIGPDGCGKKTLVENVALESKAVIVTIDGPELNRPLPGETERLMKKKFTEALLHCSEGLTILLILRIESICNKEGRLLSEILHLLDSIPSSSPLIVIGTTSKPHALHGSIRSSARFQTRIIINIPTENERCELIRGFCGDILPEENILTIAKKTPGFVVADIKLLVSRAKRKTLMNYSDSEISKEAFLSALNECIYQIEPSSIRGELGVVKADKLEIRELGGLENIKKILIQSVQWPLIHPEAFKRLGIQRPSGVLLYGPPGCAKTSLAKAMAASSNVTFLSVSAADLFSPYVGDAEITITDLFQRARDASPALLFIDEIDALVGSREDKHRGPQERVLSTFLVEMDGVGVKAESFALSGNVGRNITVIAATNRPNVVDPALLRPGRLDRLVYVPPPSLEDRLAILKVLTERVPLGDCVNLNYIAEKTALYSGADLKTLCQEAALQALTKDGMDTDLVKQEHWIKALSEIPPSLTKDQVNWYNTFSFS